jgi:hypothetical protein
VGKATCPPKLVRAEAQGTHHKIAAFQIKRVGTALSAPLPTLRLLADQDLISPDALALLIR